MANDENYTPKKYVDTARLLMGSIDVDPTSNEVANTIVQARAFMGIDSSCLDNPDWRSVLGENHPDMINVFMNPPYSREAGLAKSFVNELIKQYDNGIVRQAVILLNNCTGNKWWQPLWRFPHCFVSPRIQFLDENLQPQTSPRYDNVFIYLPVKDEEHGSSLMFKNLFSQYGHVTNLNGHLQ